MSNIFAVFLMERCLRYSTDSDNMSYRPIRQAIILQYSPVYSYHIIQSNRNFQLARACAEAAFGL